jgi:hypothetical protein
MNEQKALFSFEDSGDRNFEYKRAKKQAQREREGRIKDLIIKLPYVFTEKQFLVSRTQSGEWWCQAHNGRDCQHIRVIRRLLQLKKEAGYDMTDKAWLEQVLVVGQVKGG